jgi:hypothetical protein
MGGFPDDIPAVREFGVSFYVLRDGNGLYLVDAGSSSPAISNGWSAKERRSSLGLGSLVHLRSVRVMADGNRSAHSLLKHEQSAKGSMVGKTQTLLPCAATPERFPRLFDSK